MGTRADFYAGKGKDAEWLGSIAWDGSDISRGIDRAKDEKAFRRAVKRFLKSRDDATFTEQGWPWPWNDSGTTDCSYWFFGDRVWHEIDKRYVPRDAAVPADEADERKWLKQFERIDFPDMSARKNVTMGKRSGLIVISAS